MSFDVQGLGPLVDITTAIGLVKDGQLDPTWFASPGGHVGQMLRDQGQRDALLRAANQLLAQGAPAVIDDAGRHWIQIVAEDAVALHVVVSVSADGKTTDLGIGVRVHTTAPESQVQAYVPLLHIPANGAATVALGQPTGRVALAVEVAGDEGPPAPGVAGLRSLHVGAEIPTDGVSPPLFSASLLGLQLPGQSAPNDVSLGGDITQLGDQAIRLVLGLIQQSVATASGELAELLALVGISSDQAIPPLPIEDLLAHGLPAWRTWLETLLADSNALVSWLTHLGSLVGPNHTLTQAASPGLPGRVSWTLASGLSVAIVVTVARTPAGAPSVEIGLEGSLSAAGTPPGSLEFTATLTRITLGATPSVVGLPRLELSGRVGHREIKVASDRLLDAPSPGPAVGSLRIGITLDETRRVAFVLAAHDVVIGLHNHTYEVLDLTNAQTLADVAGNALSDLATEVLGKLGTAGTAVRVLLGLTQPAGQAAWPVPLTPIPDLLANPIAALVAYHQRVLSTNRAGYAAVLDPLRKLLSPAGFDAPITGTGDEATPWSLVIANGARVVAVVAWTAGTRLELGVAVDCTIVDLGGGCPTVALGLVARVASIALDASGSHALPGASARITFGARGGVPLRIGDSNAAIIAQRAGVELVWTPDSGFNAALVMPGLAAVVDGEEVAFALPMLASNGTLSGAVPWRALELLMGHVLVRLGPVWAEELTRLLGWLPGEGRDFERLPLESLTRDPVSAVQTWAAARVREGNISELARRIALAVTGPAAPRVRAGIYRGRGDSDSPAAIPLTGGGATAALRVELLMWAGLVADNTEALDPGDLISALSAPVDDANPSPGAARIASALLGAAAASDVVADVMAERLDVGSGFAALVSRWADTDGMVRAADAVLPGATVHDLDNVTHLALPDADLPGITGVGLDVGTIVVIGPMGPGTWPGVDTNKLIDLSAPGIVPEAFDLSRLDSEDGPWLVRLPSRADAAVAPGDDGAALQAARLARVVDAVVVHVAGGAPVALVAHGAAGHAAAAVAGRSGITQLVTVGTPHGGVGLDVLESQPVAGVLQLLTALLPPADVNRPELDSVTLGRGLIEVLRAAYDATASPLADLTPPVTPPVIPAAVEVHCVRGRCSAGNVAKAIAGLVVRGLEGVAESDTAHTSARDDSLGLGIGVALDPPTAPGDVHVTIDLALMGRAFAGNAQPGLRARVSIGRVGGWLAGGPDPARPAGVSRQPSLRRAEIEFDLLASGAASARLVFHEACALGVSKRRWIVSQNGGGDPLLPEARILVGRLAAALGPLPATGPVRLFVDMLGSLGLLDETSGVAATGASIGFSTDGVRRLLVDPGALFADLSTPVRAARAANALAALLGAAAPQAATPTKVVFQLGGFTIRGDLAAGTVHIEVSGLALVTGATIAGTVDLGSNRTLVGQLSVAFGDGATPNGRPVLELSAAPLQVRLRWEGGGVGMPAAVVLAPTVDGAGIARLLTRASPALALWAGITFLRSVQPGAVALVDPVLAALGLLSGSGGGAIVVPAALLSDPGHWFTHPSILGTGAGTLDAARIDALLDAVGALLSVPQPRPGAWTLPYGMELAAGSTSGRSSITLGIADPSTDTGLRVGGSLGLALGANGVPATPTAELILALPGGTPLTSSGRVTLSLGSGGLSARLIMPGSGIDIALLPNGPGLAAVGTVAATYALPLVLDALVDALVNRPDAAHGVGIALGDLGDALELRVAGHFVGAKLVALQQGGAILAPLLSHDGPAAFTALASVLTPAMPNGYSLKASGTNVVFTYTGGAVKASLSVGSTSAGIQVSGAISGVQPFAGANLGGALSVDPSGLVEARATFGVDDPSAAIALGPITLAPVAELAIGSNPPNGGPRIAVGLATGGGLSVRGVLHMDPSPHFALEPTSPSELAEALLELLLPLVFDVALSTDNVRGLLDTTVFGGPGTVGELLDRVVLKRASGNWIFDPASLGPELWNRLLGLAGNIAGHLPRFGLDPLEVGVSVSAIPGAGGSVYGIAVSLPPGKRYDLISDGVTISIEVDPSWISSPASADGLVVELLRIPTGVALPKLSFGISVRGIGVRIGRDHGPLIDSYLVVDSVAVHSLLTVTTSGVTEAGGQLELGNLRIAFGGASGGTNEVANGVLRDSASGGKKPELKFSPALAVQSQGGGPPRVDLRAGEGDGPWWVTLQRGFGPVYIEQVGIGVSRSGDQVSAVRVMVDGKVSFMGLTVAVDDLAIGAKWPTPPLSDPSAWSIDLAGLAVAANTSGVSLSGGLRKSPGELPDYTGMISIRFGVYGITAYGGYAVVTDESGKFTSLFIFGALCAPIGGIPAFFVTGLGAGVGVNRRLLIPSDFNQFPNYPLLQALDPNSEMANPDTALDKLRLYFPSARGSFWFAAGLSFNSFSLIQGIAVIAVAIGDGLDISLLGLARAALPNPAFPLVQIELALVVRFSSREGLLWVQAQLTDNSFLLTRDCRLTGGFAYVMWFKGDLAGHFVVTLGGYHPSFHRDGYPAVPRLGFVWCVSDVLVIKGESYFALVSEAVMAGMRFEASLTVGPLWAYLRLGADAIVYFDPFHFQATAFAELGAGITIDIDLGPFGHLRITLSIQLHADVFLEGPQFHGSATIDLGITSATIAFGDWSDRSTKTLSWTDFAAKYLRPGNAAVLTAVPGRGILPPSTAGSKKVPTGGGIGDPFLVLPEFSLTLTTTAATSSLTPVDPKASPPPIIVLAIGPMQLGAVTSTLSVTVKSADGKDHAPDLNPTPLLGYFPKGAWAPQSQNEPKPVPAADVVEAINGVQFTAAVTVSAGTVPIDYYQVDIGKRLPLPFLSERLSRSQWAGDVLAADALVAAAPSTVAAVLVKAREWLTQGAHGSSLTPTAAALFGARWVAPPQLVPITHGMAVDPGPAVVIPKALLAAARPALDSRARPPRVDAILMGTPTAPAISMRTTVGTAGDKIVRVTPRRLSEARTAIGPHVATRLVRAAATAVQAGNTVIAAGSAPFTSRAGTGGELRRQSGQAPWRAQRLSDLSTRVQRDGLDVLGGELLVLSTENGLRDTEDARPTLAFEGDLAVRLVVMDIAGAVTLDTTVRTGTVPLPRHTERFAVIGGGGQLGGASGWHSGTQLAQVGARALLGPGCTVHSSAVVTRRGSTPVATGFTVAADAVRGYSIVTTGLPSDVTAVAIVLEAAARVDDHRGDVLDLGLEGASRVVGPDGAPLPPRTIVIGSRTISVYAVRPDGKGKPVGVTVASGEHVHLSGVIGGRNGADALTDALRRGDVASTLGGLFDAPNGKTRVRWNSQPKRPTMLRSRRVK